MDKDDDEEDDTEGQIGHQAGVSEETKLEVGETFELRSLPCTLILVMETWPDWLLAVGPYRASKHVFCDSQAKELLESCGVCGPSRWHSVSSLWNHDVLKEKDLCILVSGSSAFVDDCVEKVPETAKVVAAVPRGKRTNSSKGRSRLVWKTVQHRDVGGVTTARCSLAFPREWGKFVVRPHVQRRVKHVLVHSELPRRLRRNEILSALRSVNDLLDCCALEADFALPVRTRSGDVPGKRKLMVAEIAAAFDLPVQLAKELQERGRESPLYALALSGSPAKFLSEALQHVYTSLTGRLESYDMAAPQAVALTAPRMRFSEGPRPEAEASLPDWARVCQDNDKAAKADGAKPNVPMWDLRIQANRSDLSSDFLARYRELLMIGWRRRCYLSFIRYLRGTYGEDWSERSRGVQASNQGSPSARQFATGPKQEGRELVRDIERGTEVLTQIFGGDGVRKGGSFWDWDAGSSLLFWRWPPEVRRDTRDGAKVYIKGKLPQYKAPQRVPGDKDQAQHLRQKLWRVRERGYICPGPVQSLTNVFAVPKVQNEAGEVLDVRPVYDATKSGLNEAVWAPPFWLPTTNTLLRMMDFDTWLGDIDLGEMFLNFQLDPRIRPYAGVDLTGFCTKTELKGRAVLWERWCRTLMGFSPSPFTAIREELIGEEVVRGDRLDPSNIFRWDRVRLNLPGSGDFNPAWPWVSQVFTDTTEAEGPLVRIACNFATFVDDIRAAGYSLEAAWKAMRRVASMLNYLGIQDAPRKRRSPLKTEAGAWIGALQRVYDQAIVVLTSQQKWDKAKRIIKELLEQVQSGKCLNLKTLLKQRGFLVHLSMTYPLLVPYLKGLHLTADSWRDGRDPEGWRLARVEMEALLAGCGGGAADAVPSDPKAPKEVKPVPRLEHDLLCLTALTEGDLPAERVVRAKTFIHIIYGFGDASGTGFGSSAVRLKALGRLREIGEEVPIGVNQLRYRIGVWGKDAEAATSNYRELRNIVEAVELEEKKGGLQNALIFFCTDNTVTEAGIYKGSSSNSVLNDLILRIKRVEMRTGCENFVCHVSGKRMIAQGTDGVSRGNLAEGVMAGLPMASFLPFHLSAPERSSGLEDWVRSWLGPSCEFLTPEGWYERGHDFDGGRKNFDGVWMPKTRPGIFVWSPPPAAAEAAIEELRKARHKRQASTHAVLVPRLLTPKWRKQLHKACDCVFEMPAGCGPAWPSDMFEPCLIGICFPYLKHRPWQLRGVPRLLALERTVQGLWEEGDSAVSACLCKFFDKARRFPGMPENVVRKMLYV